MNESEQREGWVLLMQKFVFKEVNDKPKFLPIMKSLIVPQKKSVIGEVCAESKL